MSDTKRTETALLALLPNAIPEAIGSQDLRDVLVSVFPVPLPLSNYGTDRTAFVAAIAAIGGEEANLYLGADDYSLDDDLTIPANVNIEFEKGAIITIASAKTLTISGRLTAGLYQIFDGDGSVVIDESSVGLTYPEWWGLDTADFYAAVNAAVNSGGKAIQLPAGTLSRTTDTAIDVPEGVHIFGHGQKTILSNASGTNDIFTSSADSVGFHNFKMNGPDNTSCDGILLNDLNDFIVENIYGYQLSSTITVGSTASCSRGLISNVNSYLNTQQGIHISKGDDIVVTGGVSRDIGSSNLHHGCYIGNATNITVTNFSADGCYGSGIHVYSQSTFDAHGIIISNNRCIDNGVAAAGARGNILVSAASGSTMENVILSNNYTFNGSGYNIYIGGVLSIEIINNIMEGNATTTNNLYIESIAAANRFYHIQGNRIHDSASNGIRLVFTDGTIVACIIEGNIITTNPTGIYATGGSVDNIFIGASNIFSGNTTDLNGTFEGMTSSITPLGVVAAMAGHETFKRLDGNIFIKDPDGSARNFNPTGTFPALHTVMVINTADAAETITFDSATLSAAIAQNERGIFTFNGTIWLKVYVGS
jgi:hypothetical protein